MWLAYPSSYNLTGSIILTSSYKSYLSHWYTYITRSITLSPPSLTLSLKIFPIFRLFTRGVVSFYLICCLPSLMPPSIASIYCAVLITLILSISEVILSYSYYIKKGLIYIIIIALFSYSPLSCTKYIYCPTLLSYLALYLSCYRVLGLIRC